MTLECIQVDIWSQCYQVDSPYRGQYCQCVTCLPIGYCVENPCEYCDGPTEVCILPGYDE